MKKIVGLFLFLIVFLSGLIFNSASGLAANDKVLISDTSITIEKVIENNPKNDSVAFQEISILTKDSLNLFGWLKAGDPEIESPLIVMLPMMGQTHKSYDPFIKAFTAQMAKEATPQIAMPHFLSLDLRGHGQSILVGKDTLLHAEMKKTDFAKIPSDVIIMIETILARKDLNIDRGEIYIIGASIGANSAAILASQFDQIAKVVLLSPGENYRDLEPAKSMTFFSGKTLILAEMDDIYSARSSDNLEKLNNRCLLKLFDGHDHGTNIINNDPEAMQIVISWLLR